MSDRKDRTRRLKALGEGLKTMFGELSARPVPDRITSVVDQLDGSEKPVPGEASKASRLN